VKLGPSTNLKLSSIQILDNRNELYRGRTKLAERGRYRSDPVLAQLYYKQMNGTITQEELVVLNSFSRSVDPATKSGLETKKKYTSAVKSYLYHNGKGNQENLKITTELLEKLRHASPMPSMHASITPSPVRTVSPVRTEEQSKVSFSPETIEPSTNWIRHGNKHELKKERVMSAFGTTISRSTRQ
jgi:hypothetical protein